MVNYCGNCTFFDWNDKTSIGYRCTCMEFKYRRRKVCSWYCPPSRKGCSHFKNDSNKHYIPKKGGKRKGMQKYYVAFIGTSKRNDIIIKHDFVPFCSDTDLGSDDMMEISEYIGHKFNLKSVTILNIMKMKN